MTSIDPMDGGTDGLGSYDDATYHDDGGSTEVYEETYEPSYTDDGSYDPAPPPPPGSAAETGDHLTPPPVPEDAATTYVEDTPPAPPGSAAETGDHLTPPPPPGTSDLDAGSVLQVGPEMAAPTGIDLVPTVDDTVELGGPDTLPPTPDLLPPDATDGIVPLAPIDTPTVLSDGDELDFGEWQSEFEEWRTALNTTGTSPLVGGDHTDEPWGDSQFWFRQNSTFTCGPASATQIISDFTGQISVNENDLANYVTEKQWWVDENLDGTIDGMGIDHLAQLMTDKGVPSAVTTGTLDNVSGYLAEGRAVVLFLDNENLPGQAEQDGLEGGPQDDANHFVRITGIDTARGIAYLSDPGRADGQNLQVPLTMLEEAWNDSGHQMVVTTGVDPTPDGQATTTTPAPAPTPPTTTTTTGNQNPAGVPPTGVPPTGTTTGPDGTTLPPQGTPDGTPPPPDETPTTPTGTDGPDDARSPDADEPSVPAPRSTSAPASLSETTRVTTERISLVPDAPGGPVSMPATPSTPVAATPDLALSERIDSMLEAATVDPVDLSAPASQPDGLFDPRLGFVVLPVAVSAGVAATLGYAKLRNR